MLRVPGTTAISPRSVTLHRLSQSLKAPVLCPCVNILATGTKTHTHRRLHSFPRSSPRTQTARPGRCVWRTPRRSRWLACSPGAGSPSARTAKNSWSLQRRKQTARSGWAPGRLCCCVSWGDRCPHCQADPNAVTPRCPAKTDRRPADLHTL